MAKKKNKTHKDENINKKKNISSKKNDKFCKTCCNRELVHFITINNFVPKIIKKKKCVLTALASQLFIINRLPRSSNHNALILNQ